MDLILPDLNANSFKTASGKEYIIYPTVGTGRFPMLEICMIEIQHGLSVSGFKSEILEAYELQNKSKFADVSVKLHNLQNGFPVSLAGRCTLYSNCVLCLSVHQVRTGKRGAKRKHRKRLPIGQA